MGSVRVLQKPEMVSYDDIHDIIVSAHASLDNGITLNSTKLTGSDLSRIIGHSGICLVAYLDNRLAGTASICWEQIDRWGYHEIFGTVRFLAVEPWARGKGIGTALMREVISICSAQNRKSILSTVYNNKVAKALYRKNNYIPIRHYGEGHYCVTMAHGVEKSRCFFFSITSFLYSRAKHMIRR